MGKNTGERSAWSLLIAGAATFFLTVLSLGVSVYLVSQDNLSEDGKRLAETCSTTWKIGFGAIVGLIGGKAL
ncbi:MAG TPA: hypothetical protein VE988_28560 [Gemmataceae bacterium]|nr:hypothetical protein [Gemmataceae bacterium]